MYTTRVSEMGGRRNNIPFELLLMACISSLVQKCTQHIHKNVHTHTHTHTPACAHTHTLTQDKGEGNAKTEEILKKVGRRMTQMDERRM